MGLSFDDFWDLTPLEFDLMARGWRRREEARTRETAWHACIIANTCGHMTRPLRVEDLVDGEKKSSERKADLFELVKSINAEMGGADNRHTRPKKMTPEEIREIADRIRRR